MTDWISWGTRDPMDVKGKKGFFENTVWLWYLYYISKQCIECYYEKISIKVNKLNYAECEHFLLSA